MYFGKVVPGSNAYWRSKKPNYIHGLIIILKKGEDHQTFYFWPDLKKPQEDYIYITEGMKVDLDVNLHKLHQALNDNTIIVQELFQIHIDEFLKTIGLEVFGIKHYW